MACRRSDFFLHHETGVLTLDMLDEGQDLFAWNLPDYTSRLRIYDFDDGSSCGVMDAELQLPLRLLNQIV